MAPANGPSGPKGPNSPRIRENAINESELQRKIAAYPVDFQSGYDEPVYEDEEFVVFTTDETGGEIKAIAERYDLDLTDLMIYMNVKCRDLGVGIPMGAGYPLVVRKTAGESTDADTDADAGDTDTETYR